LSLRRRRLKKDLNWEIVDRASNGLTIA